MLGTRAARSSSKQTSPEDKSKPGSGSRGNRRVSAASGENTKAAGRRRRAENSSDEEMVVKSTRTGSEREPKRAKRVADRDTEELQQPQKGDLLIETG
jgi:hypothetical protein